MFSRFGAIFAALVLSAPLLLTETPATRPAPTAPLLYTAAREYRTTAWTHGDERFPSGATIFVSDQRRSKRLIPDFFATADANVSFDGGRVLFAGKKRALDRWQIWEVAISSGYARQITHCDDNCVLPLYVPPDRLVYAHKVAGKFVLEIALLNGEQKTLQLSYGPGNFFPSDVLRDGRILFQAAYPLDDSGLPELYTVYSDGSGVEAYRCDHGRSRYAGKQISSGDIVFTREGTLFRFTSAVAHEVPVNAPAGNYAGDVIETSDGAWLVSVRSAEQKSFELVKWKAGAGKTVPQIADSRVNIIQPALLAPRPVPNQHPSGLHEWSYANVLCLNAYTSKSHIAEGLIASVRTYTRDSSGEARLLGTAPVEKDGSFYLRLPGDQPLKIELLDSGGNTVKREAGWFWLRGGEQRACVGCHAGPETAPENAVPAVLLHSIVAADMTKTAQASPPAGGH